MERTPNTPNTLLLALNPLAPHNPLQLLPIRLLQQHALLQYLARFQVAHADGFLPAVDVGARDDWVLARSRRDGDFDAWIFAGEFLEAAFYEGAELVRR